MLATRTGSEIVADMANGRPWWKLRACDIRPWVKSLHPSATQELVSRTEWIGDDWNGRSDIRVGDAVVSGAHANLLIDLINEHLPAIAGAVQTLDGSSLRQALYGPGARQCLAIDFDLGEFVLPVAIDESDLRKESRMPLPAIAEQVLTIVRKAVEQRDAILRRETKMRCAFDETVTGIGDGAGALWMRMDPIRCSDKVRFLTQQDYQLVMVILDRTLDWVPVGSQRVYTVKDVREYGFLAGNQRNRAQAILRLDADNSKGWVGEVALALINEHQLDASEVFDQVRGAARNDFRGAVDFLRDGKRERLHYRDGIVHAYFEVDGGHYHDGCLTIWGDFSPLAAREIIGRPLSSFVHHPLLLATNAKVERVEARSEALDLWHTRVIPVEQAARTMPRVAVAA